MSWVLDYMADLESDFSVFHRVEDIHSLDGPRFFRLALRLFAYDGVLTKRLQAEQEKRGPSLPAPTPPSRPGATSTGWQTTSLEGASPLLNGERREVRRDGGRI